MCSPAGSSRCTSSGSPPAAGSRQAPTTPSSLLMAGVRWRSSRPGTAWPSPESFRLQPGRGSGRSPKSSCSPICSVTAASYPATAPLHERRPGQSRGRGTDRGPLRGHTPPRGAGHVGACVPPRALPAHPRQAEPYRRLAGGMGLFGLRSYEKFIPTGVLASPTTRSRSSSTTYGRPTGACAAMAEEVGSTMHPLAVASSTTSSRCCSDWVSRPRQASPEGRLPTRLPPVPVRRGEPAPLPGAGRCPRCSGRGRRAAGKYPQVGPAHRKYQRGHHSEGDLDSC